MARDKIVDGLIAKQAISEVITTYARAIDRLDETLLRSVFHPGSQHEHFFIGPSSDLHLIRPYRQRLNRRGILWPSRLPF